MYVPISILLHNLSISLVLEPSGALFVFKILRCGKGLDPPLTVKYALLPFKGEMLIK